MHIARTNYAPLIAFPWDGEELRLMPGVVVSRLDEIPWPEHPAYFYSEADREEIAQASHWLCFEPQTGVAKDTEVVMIFQIALWLVAQTRTFVPTIIQSPNEVTRLNTRFSYVKGYVEDYVSDAQMQEVATYLKAFFEIAKVDGRLDDALFMTFNANQAARWAAEMINLGSALECLLTYSKGGGITSRLAKTFACLTENGGVDEKARRDAAFARCSALYDVRSNIMHGRMVSHRAPASNAHNLFEWRCLVRDAWKAILVRPDALRELELDDKARKAFFKTIEAGYTPPGPPPKRKVASRMRSALTSSKKVRSAGAV